MYTSFLRMHHSRGGFHFRVQQAAIRDAEGKAIHFLPRAGPHCPGRNQRESSVRAHGSLHPRMSGTERFPAYTVRPPDPALQNQRGCWPGNQRLRPRGVEPRSPVGCSTEEVSVAFATGRLGMPGEPMTARFSGTSRKRAVYTTQRILDPGELLGRIAN